MDRARMNAAIRVFNEGMEGKRCTKKDLQEITAADFNVIYDEITAGAADAIVA